MGRVRARARDRLLALTGSALEAVFNAPYRISRWRWSIIGPTWAVVVRAPSEVHVRAATGNRDGAAVKVVLPMGSVFPVVAETPAKTGRRVRLLLPDGRKGWIGDGESRRETALISDVQRSASDSLISIRQIAGRLSPEALRAGRERAQRLVAGELSDAPRSQNVSGLPSHEPLIPLTEGCLIAQIERLLSGVIGLQEVGEWSLRIRFDPWIGIPTMEIWDCLVAIGYPQYSPLVGQPASPFSVETARQWISYLEK